MATGNSDYSHVADCLKPCSTSFLIEDIIGLSPQPITSSVEGRLRHQWSGESGQLCEIAVEKVS